MQYYKIFFSLMLIFCTSFSQNYKKVKIYFDDQTNIKTLIEAGVALDHFEVGKDNSIIVFISDEEFSFLKSMGIQNDILIDNWFEYYANLKTLSPSQVSGLIENSRSEYNVAGFHLGSMGGYMTLTEAYAELDTLKNLFPNLITAKQSLGNTIEGRPVYMVKISDNPDVDENEPEVLYTALHHAREPMSLMQMFYFMYYLLENYNSDQSVQYLVNNRAMYFIPAVNPDGYEYNRSGNPNGGGMWRKNRRNNGSSYGVDLNRNYGPYEYWNAGNGGSSITQSSDTYRGTAPFSEPETQMIKDFLASRKIRNTLNYHTYGKYLIYPYGALSYETSDSSIFREYAKDMTRFNKYNYGTDMQTVRYSTRGNSDDYFYDGDTLANGGKIFAMTPEVGNSSDGFWPPQSRIFPLAQENLHPNLYYAWVAGEYVLLDNPNFTQSFFNPGDVVQIYPSVKNKGLSTAYNIQVELTSLSSFVAINSGIINIDSIQFRNTLFSINPLSFTVSSSTPIDTEIKLLFTASTFGTEVSQDTVAIVVYTAVPVELISFTGKVEQSKVMLSWGTATEINNRGFEIERASSSTTPIQGWVRVGFVSGAGNSSSLKSYSFIDNNDGLFGKYFYRLKQIDMDGSYKYSNEIEVQILPGKFSLEQNYPNPFNPNTIISWQSPVSSWQTLKIYDVLGNEAITLVDEYRSAGKYEIEFDGSILASGVYFYQLRSNSYIETKKITLLK